MEVYTAVPLISSDRNSNAPHIERIHSRAARSLLKVLLFLITVLGLVSVIVIHSMHKQRHSNVVYSIEDILGEKDIPEATVSRFVEEETPKTTVRDNLSTSPRTEPISSALDAPHGSLRGFSNGPMVHRMIVVRPARVMDVDATQQFLTEFERDVMQVMSTVEREMHQTMNAYFGAMGGFGNFPMLEDFFKGPLSGFEEIHRPCSLPRRDISTPVAASTAVDVAPVTSTEVDQTNENHSTFSGLVGNIPPLSNLKTEQDASIL